MKRILFLFLFTIILTNPCLSQREKVEPKRGMVGIQLSRNENGQYLVQKVFSNSPAQAAGLKQGDLLLRVKERDLSGLEMHEVLNLFNGDPLTEVEVAVMRSGGEVPPMRINRIAPKDLYEKSPDFNRAAKNAPQSPVKKPAGKKPPQPYSDKAVLNAVRIRAWLTYFENAYGFRAILLDEKYGRKTGALFSEGLLVIEVKPGTRAAKKGLEKWDIIFKIGGRDPAELIQASDSPNKNLEPAPLDLTLMGVTGERNIQL